MWFNRKPKEDIQIHLPPTSRLEVEMHKGASIEAANKALEDTGHLNHLLIENGFTLKIFLAAGGHLPVKPKSGSGS